MAAGATAAAATVLIGGARYGWTAAAWALLIGAPLTVAGAAMYFLPGPGFPVLVTGLALLITGHAMTLAARR
ncbi:PGPGW domain-containing protein [Streptomyces sp. NPDC046685]|uniref:PGPGW domain-containing protein n=1 Tax=Streptomyces sp. NPDC046685 TaxID=3157202 RepID=UPI0033E71BA1